MIYYQQLSPTLFALYPVPGFEDVTWEDWEEMLDNVQLTDMDQAQIAAILTQRFLFPEDAGEEFGQDLTEEEGDDDDDDDEEGSRPSSSFPWSSFPRTPKELRDYVRQLSALRTVSKLITLRALLPIVRPKDIRRAFVSAQKSSK